MEFSVARENMVESQIRPNGVTDIALVAALAAVERENFVDEARRSVAYLDKELPIGNGRYLLEPMVLGRLLQLAEIKSTDLVLDIGPGTGYSTAVIARIAESVVGIEQDKVLCEASSQTLLDMGVINAAIICGDHVDGVSCEAPFDVIVINGQVRWVPQSLFDQLGQDGRLVAVVGAKDAGRAMVYKKQGEKLSSRAVFNASAPFLTGFETPAPGFQF